MRSAHLTTTNSGVDHFLALVLISVITVSIKSNLRVFAVILSVIILNLYSYLKLTLYFATFTDFALDTANAFIGN